MSENHAPMSLPDGKVVCTCGDYNCASLAEIPGRLVRGRLREGRLMEGNTFGLWLRENRDRLGLSREEVGERLDISAVYVAKLEQGVKSPSPKVRVRAQQYFESPTEEFKVGDVIKIQGISFRIKSLTLAMGHSPSVELTPLIDETEI